ncbi:MAG: thiamine pyrophosphate-binding protein [Chloroflexi bacterium]|nr:thiamine pyrophosphate-binding protein [Chloroflexota bacterium]
MVQVAGTLQDTARLTGGQALVQSLVLEGVDTIFAIPGIQLDWAFDALYAERQRMRIVHTRHEQAAGYMADGYARATGRVGVYLVVPGPGVLNTGAALATAYACNSRVLCLTGQIQSDLIEGSRGVLHEIPDQLGVLRHLTKWAARGTSPQEIPGLVHEAFRQIRSGRTRPAALEIPPDVLATTREVTLGEPLPPIVEGGDPDRLAQAAVTLGQAERPLIVAGGGVLAAGAWEELRELAEQLGAPVLMTGNGLGSLPASHPLALTLLALPELLPTADAVLAVGSRITFYPNRSITPPPGVPLIRIDADGTQLYRGTPAAIGIVADAKLALGTLVEGVAEYPRERPDRRAELAALKAALADDLDTLEPQGSFGRALREELPDDTIFVSESTQVGYWATNNGLRIERPRGFLTSGYQGTLGYGFPTALGAQVGRPDRRVVSLNGDGGFMFNVQELATAVQHHIPLITVVFDDGAYGNVRRIQEHQFGGRTIASDLRNPPFAKLAEAFGMLGLRAEEPEELRAALRTALSHDGPVLIEVPVGPMPQLQQHLQARRARRKGAG